MADKLRWGILGTGNIARQFVAGLTTSRRGIAAAVGSRQLQSAQAFAQIHQIPRAHGSYESLVADAQIDVVYISLPNSLHQDWTIRALSAGKHVLCEKPIGLNAAQAEEMFDAAEASGKSLMEAFMYRSHPQTLALVDAVASGEIGKLQLIRTSFCFHARKTAGNIRFVRPLGGGSLMDIGCYCISFARLFAGAEPTKIHAVATIHSSGVDDRAAGTLVFPSGILSTFACGLSLEADNSPYPCGTEGYIEVPTPWKPTTGNSRFIVARGTPPKMDNPQSTPAPPPREVREIPVHQDLYGLEADDFDETVLDGRAARISPEDSIGNMRVLDEMRRQIGLEF